MPIKYAVPAGSMRILLLIALAVRYTGCPASAWDGWDGLDTHPPFQISGRFGHSFGKTRDEEDPEVLCLSPEAFVLWHLGYPDRARAKSQQAVSLARSFAHTASVAQAVTIGVLLERLRGNTAESHGEQHPQETEAQEAELVGFFTNGYSQRTPLLQSGLTAIQLTGGKLLRPYALTLLANAYGETEQWKEGLTVLREALAQVQASGESWWEAELYRLRGELLLQRKAG